MQMTFLLFCQADVVQMINCLQFEMKTHAKLVLKLLHL